MKKMIVKNFKEMSLLLKILFALGIYSLIDSLIALIGQRAVDFSYFGSEFPKSMPIVWHIYSVGLAAVGVYVFLKRSHSLLVKYTLFNVVILLLGALNSIYYLYNLADQTRVVSSGIVYLITFFLAILITVYIFSQKKYFNKP